MFLVANIEDIEFALKRYAQAVSHPMCKLWLMTIPKAWLLENDFDREANFVRLKPRFLRLKPPLPAWKIACKCRNGKPVLANESAFPSQPFDPPLWVKAALQKQQPVYLFDLAVTSTTANSKVWQQIDRIRAWFIIITISITILITVM